jgi:hypothetical protein
LASISAALEARALCLGLLHLGLGAPQVRLGDAVLPLDALQLRLRLVARRLRGHLLLEQAPGAREIALRQRELRLEARHRDPGRFQLGARRFEARAGLAARQSGVGGEARLVGEHRVALRGELGERLLGIALVDPHQHRARVDRLALDHRALGDPARDAARHGDHVGHDARVLLVQIQCALAHLVGAGEERHAEHRGDDDQVARGLAHRFTARRARAVPSAAARGR